MKILGIIPARGGSKGVPGKNIKLLNGKSLLAYTAEVALQSTNLTDVILSTDDEKIIHAGRNLNLKIPFSRPAVLAADDTPTIDVVAHALEWYKNQHIFYDAVCILQVTSPFRTVSFLNQAIRKFIDSGCDSLVSVQKVPHEYNPHWTFVANEAGNLKIATGEAHILSRRQELPDAYHRDGVIYITKSEVIQNQNSLYGQSIAYIESPPEFYVNIDTMEDWERAEQIARNSFNMCGIAGIIGKSVTESNLRKMLQAQKHRGPDATGEFYDAGFAALGHNRLSIIDLSECANQPFFDQSKRYSLIFNGEVYNYIELREMLSDAYQFSTKSDTEVLLAAYIVWGKECLSRLNGMFSFAIWDSHSKTLFAARDRFGVKPFNYCETADTFYFSSEIKAIHAAGIEKTTNKKVWASYYAYGSYGNPDETFWDNIKQLPAGHYMEYANGKMAISQWYCFESEIKKQPEARSYEEAKKRYLELLKDSIKLRFRADVPIGFNISGGLDSSVLLALVKDFDNNSGNINAYTFYTGNPEYDELPWVESLIKNTDYPLTKVLLQADAVEAFSDKMQFHEDEPYGGIPTLAYAKIFEQAQQDRVVVLLDGQGMDEQWAGYDYYFQASDTTIQGTTVSPFRPNMLSADFLKMAQAPEYPKPFADELLNKQYRDLFYTKIPRALRFNDRISMAFSTELREPFLDYRLVEFAFALPLDFKIKNGVTKFMLREIASEYLSDNLVFAPKRPLQTPQREWLAAELKQWVASCLDDIENSEFAGWFNIEELRNEFQLYQDGKMDSAFHLWQCISLALIIHGQAE